MSILDNHSAIRNIKQHMGLYQTESHAKPSNYIAYISICKKLRQAFNECSEDILVRYKYKKRKCDGYMITQCSELNMLLTQVLKHIERLPMVRYQEIHDEAEKTDYLTILFRYLDREIK